MAFDVMELVYVLKINRPVVRRVSGGTGVGRRGLFVLHPMYPSTDSVPDNSDFFSLASFILI